MTSELNDFFIAVAGLGNMALIFSLTVVSALFFLLYNQKRAAITITLVFCITTVLIVLAKITIQSGTHLNMFHGLRSPSGHSAMSLAVYGTLATIISSSQIGKRRIISYFFAIPLIALIGIAVHLIGWHTVSDVVIGLSIGLISSFTVWMLLMKGISVRCNWLLFTIIALTILWVMYGIPFPGEEIIGGISQYIHTHELRIAPY